MELVAVGLLIAVLMSTLSVLGWMFTLCRKPRPYSVNWVRGYTQALIILRSCFQMVLILCGGASMFYLIFTLLWWKERHMPALYGGVDLVSTLAFYGLWRWSGWLLGLASSRMEFVRPM